VAVRSEELFTEARRLMPGGVSSPVRAIKPYPFYTVRAQGSRLYTADDRELIDCCMAYGPLILGHAHAGVQEAVREQLAQGWLYGTPTPLELEMARILTRDHPAVEMVRFVSSGSEATMAAIRLARGFTRKNKIVKVEGGFHGAHDGVLIRAGSGATTHGVPDSAGVLPEVAAQTLQVPYNDAEALADLLERHGDVAAFILEPVLGNIGPVHPERGYLEEVRRITQDHDVLLIFDEVITGYRLGIGGAQVRFGIRPDLATFGKIIGGGLPIGAFGGRWDIMEQVAPSGPVYQAGTFSGNPLSLAAGVCALQCLHAYPSVYSTLEDMARGIGETIGGSGSFVHIGSMFKYFFRPAPPRDYREVRECDTVAFHIFWEKMLARGVFLPPSQFETNFLSVAHSVHDTGEIADAYQACL
jgi:glutamate-1-semialdehyde 2,1-aminomutase